MNIVFCFFISLILVNVSADVNKDEETKYLREVLVVNETMKIAGADKLESIIESLAVDFEHYSDFALLNFGLAVPDVRPEEELLAELSKKQSRVGWFIRFTYKMRFPYHVDERQDIKYVSLEELARDRRNLTGPVIRTIIQRDLDEPMQDILDHGALLRACRLLGVYTSTRFPKKYIRSIDIDSIEDTCTLWNGITEKTYKRIGCKWEQIRVQNDIALSTSMRTVEPR
ncbi:uncharacterized protein LOC126843047 isoform X1 [Adelges cooleyi]|uniref:uncharacterized protein LOC126843047 isoform X1 n=1 Tax=Adelges cooleyi TaxID=133065 RepID=UPI00217F867F|nr:uncharacterized protein LOC126843047 isoform X1 [Adelges cooleyi]